MEVSRWVLRDLVLASCKGGSWLQMPSACLMGLGKAVYFTLLSGCGGSQSLCFKFPVVVDFHSELDLYVSACETQTQSWNPHSLQKLWSLGDSIRSLPLGLNVGLLWCLLQKTCSPNWRSFKGCVECMEKRHSWHTNVKEWGYLIKPWHYSRISHWIKLVFS